MNPNALDVASINKWLKSYGTSLSGKCLFKLVWSDDQREVRVGQHNVFSPSGNIYLRSFYGARDVPKYNYVHEKWVLEALNEGETPEIIGKFTYEPLWVFQTDKDEYLPPYKKAIEFILDQIFNRRANTRRGDSEAESRSQRVKRLMDSFDDSPFHGALTTGHAVSFGGIKRYE